MDLNQITDARGPSYTPGVKRPPNIKALTSIRFFAALHVALYHFVTPASLWGPFEPIMSAGYVGVSFFFILSGFILTYSRSHEYEQGRGLASKFWMARFARIYPVYLVSMILAAYVGRAEFHSPIHILAYIADLLMIQSWSIRTAGFFNAPAWSLSCEAFFYLLFPFIFLRLRPSSLKKGLLALAGIWLLAMAVPLYYVWRYPQAAWHEGTSPAIEGMLQVYRARRLPILALPEFLAGISLGWIYLRFRPSRRMASLLATTGAIAMVVALALSNHLPYVLLHNGLLIPIFGLLLLGLGEPNWLSHLLSNSVLVLLGEASYAFYLTHFLFDVWALQVFGPHGTILDALWKLAVTIPFSIILHLYVERPCRRLILQWWSRRHPAQLVVEAR
jgi:peptidoglycan/LPS O-acetylase OafA/YrhL